MTSTATTAQTDKAQAKRITFMVILAVFAVEATWNFYDAQVPPLLREHVTSAALVGVFMGMDNLIGIFVQPWIGNKSDNTRTRWGRRLPYLVVAMPLAAVLFLAIPYSAASLPLMLALMFCYALLTNAIKPIAEALMPDFVPPKRRSRANALVKMGTALTIVVSALVSILMVDDHPELAFAVPSALMVLAILVIILMGVRDSQSPAYQQAVAEDEAEGRGETVVSYVHGLRATFTDVLTSKDRSRLLLIIGIFIFSGCWSAVRALMTPYGMEVLEMSRGDAGGLTIFGGIAFIIAAYPISMFAERYGRIRTMVIGLLIFILAMLLGFTLQTSFGTMAALGLSAIGAAAILVNGVVVLWNLAPSSRVLGTYAGLFAVGWSVGGASGPAVVGVLIDFTAWNLMLLHVGVLAVLSLLVILRIKAIVGNTAKERSL